MPSRDSEGWLLSNLAAEVRALRHNRQIASGKGLHLFERTGCAACHQPTLYDDGGEPVWLFSDLLLHDMGADLEEEQRVGGATRREWRTAPLIGLSSRSQLLHDGRAITVDSAINAHAGEAQASASAFMALAPEERLVLIEFLLSL